MNVVIIVLYTLIVIVSILLIGLVLIQQSKGGGFGTAFGGVGESVFGAHAGTHLTKLTVILVSVFFVLALSLAILTGHREKSQSIVEKELAEVSAKSAAKATEAKKTDAAPEAVPVANQDAAAMSKPEAPAPETKPAKAATENKSAK